MGGIKFYYMSKQVVQHFDKRLLSHRLDDIIKRAQVDELSVVSGGMDGGGYAADFDIKSLYVTVPKVPRVVVFSAPVSSTYLITSLASTA